MGGPPLSYHLTCTETCFVSANRALPSSLLLLSRAFTVTAPVAGRPAEADLQMESLKDTLGALNREVVDEVGFEVGDIGCASLQLPEQDEVMGHGVVMRGTAQPWAREHHRTCRA